MKEETHNSSKKNSPQSFAYIHDKTTGFFHVPGCPECTKDSSQMKGFGTLKGCLKKKLHPCLCCTAIVDQYLSKQRSIRKGLLYSTMSSHKIVHFPECSNLKRVPIQNIRSFNTIEEAWNHGYCLCQNCSPLKRMYLREENELQQFCCANSMNMALKQNGIHVISKIDFWRIIIEKYKGQPELYHRNKYNNHKKGEFLLYHKQNVNASTLLESVHTNASIIMANKMKPAKTMSSLS